MAVPIASGLPAPLDVLLVRKLGHPRRPELAMGAVARVGGTEAVVRNAEVAPPGRADAAFSRVLDRERLVIFARERVYRSGRPPARMAGRTLILVDDGLATGATMRAAVSAARTVEPALITVAVPIASPEACALLGDVADDLVCPWRPAWFVAVGQGYRDFRQIGDDEVVEALA